MPGTTNRSDSNPDLPRRHRLGQLRQPLLAARWGTIEVQIGWSLPIFFVLLFGGGWWFRGLPGNADLPVLSGILAVSMVAGAILQGLLRMWTAATLGARLPRLVLRAFGSWGPVHSPPARRVVLGLAVPMLCFTAAFALALMPPHDQGISGLSWTPPELTGRLTATSVLVACVWVLTLQATAQCLPLPGCHGREVLDGTIELALRRWPVIPRETALRLILTILAFHWWLVAVMLLAFTGPNDLTYWPWAALIAIGCWMTRDSQQAMELGLAPEPNASETCRPAWRSPMAIYRQRKQRAKLLAARQQEFEEASDSEQLDAILQQMHERGSESLSPQQRAVLKRVSDRIRSRNQDAEVGG